MAAGWMPLAACSGPVDEMPISLRLATLASWVALAFGACSSPRPEVSAETPTMSSPLIVHGISEIRPFVASDGQTHLTYELLLINQSASVVTLESVAALDTLSGAILRDLSGNDLAGATRIALLEGNGNALRPSQSAFVFVDVALASGALPPRSVSHRISVMQKGGTTSGELGGLAVTVPAVEGLGTFDTAPIAVSLEAAVILDAPVRGANWIVFRGCCDVRTSHRGGTNAYGGEVRVTERFAVDLVQVDGAGMLITGQPDALASYPQYGAPVYAVADGTIVKAENGVADEVPGRMDSSLTEDRAGGNAVVLRLGNGQFAFYGHLQPDSVTVKPGDTIKTGTMIGRIGNSGKTIAPHLHFHLSTSATPGGEGLPFVFSSFTGTGMLTADPMSFAQQGQSVEVDASGLSGLRIAQHPLNNALVDFGR